MASVKDIVQIYINIAEQAFLDGNFNKTEKYSLYAERMYSFYTNKRNNMKQDNMDTECKSIKDNLYFSINAKGESIETTNEEFDYVFECLKTKDFYKETGNIPKSIANMFCVIAENALHEKNIDKAELYLLKAENLWLKAGEKKFLMELNSSLYYESLLSEDFAELLNDLSEADISAGYKETAERYLFLSLDLAPEGRVQNLLKKLLTDEKDNNENVSNVDIKSSLETSLDKTNIIYFKLYILMAKKFISDKLFEQAESILRECAKDNPGNSFLTSMLEKVEVMKKECTAKVPDYTYQLSSNADNKEEAERCIKIAEKAMADENPERAKRFLLRSLRMHEISRAKALLKEIESSNVTNVQIAKPETAAPQELKKEYSFHSPRSSFMANSDRNRSSLRHYTDMEQKTVLKRVYISKDDYEILGITENATLEEIKKAEKTLMLLLHPDKNQDVRAPHAYMKVKQAAAKLKDSRQKSNGSA